MEIVSFSNKYLKDIIDIEKESFKRPWTGDMFISSATNEAITFKAAVENGETAGFCIFWIVGGETEILNIAIAPKFRRKKFAQKLLEYIIESSHKQGSSAIFLEVRESNEPAINLYLSNGFEKIGIRKKYYIDEDAIVLRKSLE